MSEEQKEATQRENKPHRQKKVPVFGYALIFLGVAFIFEKVFGFDFFAWVNWDYIWPTALVVLGIWIVWKNQQL